jgi:hypothetical protein
MPTVQNLGAAAVPVLTDTVTATANTAALQAAVLAAHAAGGGRVYIPPGDWYFQHGLLDLNVVCQIDNLDNVCIEGAGVGITRLHLINNADSSFFNLTGGSSYISIRHMELNGNRANQTPNIVHGIRGDAFSGLWLDNLYIHDISHYGIGIEGFVQQYMFFSNLKLENLGGDGFDQKNKSDVNLFQVANNIAVNNFGLAGTTQTGWDCRGAWQISNYVCHFSCDSGSGFRMRNGELNTAVDGGFGGHRTHLNNFEIYGPGAASTSTGVEVVARDCHVTNGYIRDVLYGMAFAYDSGTAKGAQRTTCGGVTVESFGTAGFLSSTGSDYLSFDRCVANGGQYGFRIRSAHCRITSPQLYACTGAGISTDTNAAYLEVSLPLIVGVGGATMVGIDINSPDIHVFGGDITTCNRGIVSTGLRTKVHGCNSRSNVDAGFLAAVGADDASFIDCTASTNGTRGIHTRSDRTTVLGGQIISNTGAGFLTEATCDDCNVDSVYFNGNGAAIDDAGTNTRFGMLNRGLATPYLLSSIRILAGTGSPETVYAAPVGSIFHRTNGGANTSVYIKESGTGNTGWIAK